MWLLGGVFSLIGALCYAELATTYPHAGGDYHYLARAFGGAPAFLFAWARMMVIQTGSIAMLSFLVGDYASELLRIGTYSPSYYAALTITILTAVNILGIRQGKQLQKVLIAANILGLLFLVIAGLALHSPQSSSPQSISSPNGTGIGRAMIFVLLTYGGWNEAAYLSAEVRGKRRNIARALLYSIGIITLVYVTVNFVVLRGLGFSATSKSEAVAADLMRMALGENGAGFISLLVVAAALSTINAAIITGARTNYALGQDFSFFSFLGHWQERAGTPINSLLIQGVIALLLILLGTGTRGGFVMMVEYTAPVFWFFLLMVGIALFVLRWKEPNANRPFRAPFYPITPIVFCVVCSYMLQASLAYTGKGSLLGVAVLLAGMPLLLLRNRRVTSSRNRIKQI
jgi:amino acid transporter